MRTDAQRIAKYEARMVATLIDPVRTAVNADQKANYAIYATEWYEIQVRLMEELGIAAVPIIQYAAYTAFAGELYHLTKHFSGATLAQAWVDLVAKWSDVAHLGTAAGAILNAIALDVFHLDVAPITP